MLKDEHKHWKVKTVTALPHSIYRLHMYKRSDEWLASELRLMPLVWIGGKILAAAIHEPAGWRIHHKNFPRISRISLPAGKWAMGKPKLIENSILWLLWIQRTKHVPPLWTGSMDPCHGPRLRVVPHFSSAIVERAKLERAWKSPCRLFSRGAGSDDFHGRSRFARSLIPGEKWGTTRSLPYWWADRTN